MFKHILVPLDGSQLAEAALPAALELAARFDGQISLMRVTRSGYVASDLDGLTYADLIMTLRREEFEEADAYLHMMQRKLREQNYRVKTFVREGEPIAGIILALANDENVDSIVMSTHGRGGMSRWFFGSVADKVLRQATVPVVLIRAQDGILNWTQPEAMELAR